MYHNFLIHSAANGYLGCFHVLAIVNSAGRQILIHCTTREVPEDFIKGFLEINPPHLNSDEENETLKNEGTCPRSQSTLVAEARS